MNFFSAKDLKSCGGMSQTNPTVSVLVTVYNREAYLAACLDSILASTWQDFEVVVVDDGSTDGSVSVAENYAVRDPRIRFFRNEKNLGDYPNRMRAAELARGEYLKYVDADDLIYPHSLEIMVEAMKRYPLAAFALSLNQIDPLLPYPFVSSPAVVMTRHFIEKSLFGCGPTGAIIRRDAFETVGGFSGRQFVGDSELWLKLGEHWPLVSLPPALVWLRQHEGQQTHLEESNPEVFNLRLKLEEEALSSTRHLTTKEKRTALGRLRQHHARRLWSRAICRRSPRIAWRLFRASGLGLGECLGGLMKYR